VYRSAPNLTRAAPYNRSVAHVHDWVQLGKETISSLKTSDMTGLYSTEWRQTREMLLADHAGDIEREPKRLYRFVRSRSAILYGLAKRLTPARRIIFVVAFVWFFVCLFGLATHRTEFRYWPYFEMSAAFVLMVLLLAMELGDKIKFRDELELARDLQANLIPSVLPQTPQYAIAAFNRIANTVGGDIYDFVPLADGRVAILFGDASGHGMAAGLVMAVAHAAFRTQLDVDASPDAIIGSLNRILCRTGNTRSFFACCYVLVSPDGSFSATVAGHPQILRIGTDGTLIDRIGRGSYPLGIKTSLRWEELHGTLAPGERLLFHSDGLTEARNRDDHEFGDAYLETIISYHARATATELVKVIVNEWRAFTGGITDDDVSVAVVARLSS